MRSQRGEAEHRGLSAKVGDKCHPLISHIPGIIWLVICSRFGNRVLDKQLIELLADLIQLGVKLFCLFLVRRHCFIQLNYFWFKLSQLVSGELSELRDQTVQTVRQRFQMLISSEGLFPLVFHAGQPEM